MDNNYYDNQNNTYNQPTYQPPFQNPDYEVLSLGQWMLTLLIISIPCVGTIALIIWACGNGNKSRVNFARAALIFSLISAVLAIIFMSVITTMLYTVVNNAYYF